MAIDYTVCNGLDRVIEEKGNKFMALRMIKWCKADVDKQPKLDLRNYYINNEGEEVVGKGVIFNTEEGPHELVKIMCEEGFGHTDEILETIKDREDFMPSLCHVLDPNSLNKLGVDPTKYSTEDYYDPRKSLLND